MFNKLGIIATETILHVIHNGKRVQLRKDANPEQFEEIKELIRNQKEDELIKRLFGKALIVPDYSNGMFKIDEDRGIIVDTETNTGAGPFISKRIIQWAKEGLPFLSLLNFHRRIQKNPSSESAQDLYEFLEKNFIPITPNGTFIAYKKVKKGNGGYVDCHTGKIQNNVGTTVSMPRQEVNANRNETCSSGLHVCGWDYLSHFSGDVILEVEIDPVDVVSVPVDYKQSKMRVCKYHILGINGDENGGALIQEKHIETEEKYPTTNKKAVKEKQDKVKNDPERWDGMSAREIKDYIFEAYGIQITLDNKNKKSIINKANKIVDEDESQD